MTALKAKFSFQREHFSVAGETWTLRVFVWNVLQAEFFGIDAGERARHEIIAQRTGAEVEDYEPGQAERPRHLKGKR